MSLTTSRFGLASGDLVGNTNHPAFYTQFDENSAVNYVMVSATQANSLNMDLNGVNGDTSSTLAFAQLGAASNTYSAAGEAIPEPAAIGLIFVAGIGLIVAKRIRLLQVIRSIEYANSGIRQPSRTAVGIARSVLYAGADCFHCDGGDETITDWFLRSESGGMTEPSQEV
jgi:hypothetical protein